MDNLFSTCHMSTSLSSGIRLENEGEIDDNYFMAFLRAYKTCIFYYVRLESQ